MVWGKVPYGAVAVDPVGCGIPYVGANPVVVTAEPAPTPLGPSRRLADLIAVGGAAIFLMMQLTMVLWPTLSAPHPIGVVDAYSYILKAEQMRSCFRQDCKALDDLRDQLTPVPEPELNWQRNRDYHRIFYIYQPLQSVLVNGFGWIAGSLEQGYRLFTIIGEIVVGLSVVVFVFAVFGGGPGGLALILLSTVVYPGYHGLHWIVPTNVTLAVALLVWAATSRPGAHGVVLPIGAAVMLAMHPIGQVYTLAALALYLATADRQRRATWLSLGATLVILAAYKIAPHLIDRPSLTYWAHTPPADWTWWQGAGENLSNAADMVGGWARRFGGIAAACALIVIGALTVPADRRRRTALVGIAVLGLCALSLVYVVPRYPAEVFTRVWIVAVVFISGLIGRAAWSWLGALGRPWRTALSTPWADARPAGTLLIGVPLIYGLVMTWSQGLPTILDKAVNLYASAEMALDVSQPARILARVPQSARFIYMHELGMNVFLSHGAMDFAAVDYPAIDGHARAGTLLGQGGGPSYVVATLDTATRSTATQPAAATKQPDELFRPRILLTNDRQVSMISDHERVFEKLSFYINNLENDSDLKVEVVSAQSNGDGARSAVAVVPVEAAFSGWLDIDVTPLVSARSAIVSVATDGGRMLLQGVRLRSTEPAKTSWWPWDQGITVRFVTAGGETSSFAFDTTRLVPPGCRPINLMDDRGVNIVLEVTCGIQTR